MSKPYNRTGGAVILEMAIILPFLVLLVFGITELGRALFQENTLAKSVESGARYLGRAYGALDANCDPVENAAEGISWSLSETRARNLIIYGNENGGDTPLLPGLEVTSLTVSDAPEVAIWTDPSGTTHTTSPACVIDIEARAEFVSLFGEGRIAPMLNFTLMLNAATQERWIGE